VQGKFRKVCGLALIVGAGSGIVLVKSYWDIPSGAGADAVRAGSGTSEHRGVGGTGTGAFKHRVTTEPYVSELSQPPYSEPGAPVVVAPVPLPVAASQPSGAEAAPATAATQPASPTSRPTTQPATQPTAQSTAHPATQPAALLTPAPAPEIEPEVPQAKTQSNPEPSATAAPSTEAASQPDESEKSFFEQDGITGDWFGDRKKLVDRGIDFEGSLQAASTKTLSGGTDTAGIGSGYKMSINLTLDAEKLLDVKGGTFFIDFRTMDGKTNSLDGAFQSTSLVYTPDRVQISELWYEQKLLDDKLRIKLGKIDANTEFAYVANGSEFLNSSMSYSPTILDFPTDPDPSTGIVAFVYPNENLYAGAGIFDGALLEGYQTGDLGPATLFGPPASLFFIGEAGAKWTTASHQDGRIGIGVWSHTGQFARFDGGNDNGSAGPYLVIDQTIWRKNPDVDGDTQGIAAFFQYGYADPAVSAVQQHIGAGLTWTGAIPGRDSDMFGVGATWVDFSQAPGSGYDDGGELAVETFYKVVLTPWFSFKPDLQIVNNPGGVSGRRAAVVGILSALITF
jgi:porin